MIKIKLKDYIKESQSNKYEVYHCSNVKFNRFDLSKITNLQGDLYGKGFYFSDNLEYCKSFGKYIYRCSITLNKPLDLTNDIVASKQLNSLLELIKNGSEIDLEHIRSSIKNKNFTTAFRLLRKYISFETLSNLYDGVIGYCEQGGREYVVYNLDNIKIKNVEMIKNFNEFINESKNVGNLYHFTNKSSLDKILKDDILLGSFMYEENDTDLFGVSTTRNKSLNYDNKKNNIRITLDGDKLSNNYKIKPRDYWRREYNVKDNPQTIDEDEEVIMTPKGGINNIKKYILSIDYLNKNESLSNDNILRDYLIDGKYLYHYTLTENLEDILREGLIPRKNPNSYYKDGSNGVFLTTSSSLYNTNLPENLMDVMNDYNENIEEYDNKPLVRLWIDVSKLDINKFTWDDDYILNKYGWNKAVDKFDKVIESLDLWRSIVYLDNIPNSLIIKYDFDYSN